jgi:polyphosphate glucokinase
MEGAPVSEHTALGVDIGGTGIKAAPVDVDTGRLLTKRERIPTPHHSTPEAVGEVVKELAGRFSWKGPIGCTFAEVIKHGFAQTAANVDESWIGTDVDAVLSAATGCPVTVINDADAAGLAEVRWGAAKDTPGVVILITLGTGIGSALFVDGVLVPNTELGHLVIRGKDAERRASANAREDNHQSWKDWAKLVDEYLHYVEDLLSPDLFVIGGGVSEKPERFVPHLTVGVPVVPAAMENDAGIAGAALAGYEHRPPSG